MFRQIFGLAVLAGLIFGANWMLDKLRSPTRSRMNGREG